MIDTSKFEKFEKEDIQEVSGGGVSQRYDSNTPTATDFKCPICGRGTSWEGYYTDDRPDLPQCTKHEPPVKMQVSKYVY